MAFIVTLVVKTFYRSADLVQDNFYEQEVLFNAKKESMFNYERLEDKLKIEQSPKGIEIIFPTDFSFKNGTVYFYRADDKSLDKTFDFNINDTHKMVLPYSDFIVGNYEVNTKWENEGKTYLYKTIINF